MRKSYEYYEVLEDVIRIRWFRARMYFSAEFSTVDIPSGHCRHDYGYNHLIVRGLSTQKQLNLANNATDMKFGEFVRNIRNYILKSGSRVEIYFPLPP